MPNHALGSNHTFGNLLKAYEADQQGEKDAHFLLYRGEEILALCLSYKFNPTPEEVWVGDAEAVAPWGGRLAALKGQKTVPVYYSPRNRNLYEFKGYHEVTRDSTAPNDLKERKGPVPLSRIVFLKKL